MAASDIQEFWQNFQDKPLIVGLAKCARGHGVNGAINNYAKDGGPGAV